MHDTMGKLCTREIINLCDGKRLGFAGDGIVNVENGRILALLIPQGQSLFHLFGKSEEIRIPWEAIKKVGPEMILVEIPGEYQTIKRKKHFLCAGKKK